MEKFGTINATGIVSQTLVGFSGMEFPYSSGNCFSVLGENQEVYKILNFNAENWSEVINRGVDLPIKIHVLRKGFALVHDDRIPYEWYSKSFCSICTPYDLLPIQQKMNIDRKISCGAEVHEDGMVLTDHTKLPNLDKREQPDKIGIKTDFKYKFVDKDYFLR